jgi:hypothetical protein
MYWLIDLEFSLNPDVPSVTLAGHSKENEL